MKIYNIYPNLKVFRDDLYPFLGGGNKGRKMDWISRDIVAKNANALVTTGGIQSNHCRAVAIYAAQHKLKCTLVLHDSKEQFFSESGNALLMRNSGAEIVFARESSQIGSLMDIAINEYLKDGLNPYYIWGGGHTLEGGYAYIDAINELKKLRENQGWVPEYIFHASGTGSTQSGILAGLDKNNFKNTIVIGVSVARKSEHAQKIVDDYYKELCQYYHISCSSREVIVLDDYLMGGYGCYTEELKQFCNNSLKEFGFTLDTCYSGKAFWGMKEFIEKNELHDKNILFWHTGGFLNYLAEQ